MAVPWPDSDQPVEGYRVGWSFMNKAAGLLCGLTLIPIGSVLVWAWSTGLSFDGWRLDVRGGVLGALFFGFGLLMTPLGIAGLFRRRDLILGADRLQILGSEGTVETQVPYKNIARVGIVNRGYGKCIAFQFYNPQDPNTLNAGRDEPDAGGWHSLLIDNSWSVPLEYIYARLYAALQAQPERLRPGSAGDKITGSRCRERQT
jgi:hypothetical protein